MNGTDSMNDDILTAGPPLPKLTAATPLAGRQVHVTWHNGQTSVVDLAPALASRRIYQILRRDDALFRSLRVTDEGNAIEWDGGLDFSAAWLARLPSAKFDNDDFRNAMDKLGLTLDGMAAALEISRRQIAEYRKNKPIPRHISLATRYLVDHMAEH